MSESGMPRNRRLLGADGALADEVRWVKHGRIRFGRRVLGKGVSIEGR
jgi:hypothetical protein